MPQQRQRLVAVARHRERAPYLDRIFAVMEGCLDHELLIRNHLHVHSLLSADEVTHRHMSCSEDYRQGHGQSLGGGEVGVETREESGGRKKHEHTSRRSASVQIAAGYRAARQSRSMAPQQLQLQRLQLLRLRAAAFPLHDARVPWTSPGPPPAEPACGKRDRCPQSTATPSKPSSAHGQL